MSQWLCASGLTSSSGRSKARERTCALNRLACRAPRLVAAPCPGKPGAASVCLMRCTSSLPELTIGMPVALQQGLTVGGSEAEASRAREAAAKALNWRHSSSGCALASLWASTSLAALHASRGDARAQRAATSRAISPSIGPGLQPAPLPSPACLAQGQQEQGTQSSCGRARQGTELQSDPWLQAQ